MMFLALLLAVLNVSTSLSVAGLGEGEQVLSVVKRDCELYFYSFYRKFSEEFNSIFICFVTD